MTNEELGIPEFTVRKARKKNVYVKSEPLKAFELEYDLWWYSKHPLPENARFAHKFSDGKANELTKVILAWFKVNDYFAARVNTQGNYNAKLGKWVRSGATAGMADITAVVSGRHLSVEVKVGKDTVRESQLRVKAAIENAGGIYIIVRSFEDFLTQLKELGLLTYSI